MNKVTPEECNRAWQATLDGHYDAAIELYRSILARRLTLGEMNNYGTTLLLAKRPKEAEAILRDIRHVPIRMFTEVVNEYVGVALWLQNRYEEACQDWATEIERIRSKQVFYYDETGHAPILLWWASAHSGLEKWRGVAVDALKLLWRTKRTRQSRWPGSIVAFLLGKIDSEQLLQAAVETHYPRLEVRQKSKAHFYIGTSLLAQGDIEGYRRELELSLSTPQKELILLREYHLARAELAHL
jgi:hypothetical protein